MGASASTEQHNKKSNESKEQREVESLAASTGSLRMLQASFTKLSPPDSNSLPLHSLQECFSFKCKEIVCEGSSSEVPDSLSNLLDHVGASIVEVLFDEGGSGGVSWIEFVRGYLKCCGRMPTSACLNQLMRLYATVAMKAGLALDLKFESAGDGDGGGGGDFKMSGTLMPVDVVMILWMCWSMLWDSRCFRFSEGGGGRVLLLPDISHLVLSAVISCSDGCDVDFWNCNVLELEVQLPIGKFTTWAVAALPMLTDCFTQFVNERLSNGVNSVDDSKPSRSSPAEAAQTNSSNARLLKCGRAWAISLTVRDVVREEILKSCFPSDYDRAEENLLYRSSVHGRGLNRLWSNIEGYHGPLLILFSATSGDASGDTSSAKKWIIGALTDQGFENKNSFYGSSGALYAVNPVFQVFLPSGKEKNLVYSHLHTTGRVYEAHPKPVGIAFGGTTGNERIFIDEDLAKVTVRHHACDKTYQHGSLYPSQGFLPVEALISEVEVWGLGGKSGKQVQTSYKKREELFIGQRRKVDLKNFASWEDSPEKMMMDMMSDPNTVRREDR